MTRFNLGSILIIFLVLCVLVPTHANQSIQIENAKINLNKCSLFVNVPNVKKQKYDLASKSKCEFLLGEDNKPKFEKFNRDSVLLVRVQQNNKCFLRALILKQNQQGLLSSTKRDMKACDELVSKSEYEFFYFQESLKI